MPPDILEIVITAIGDWLGGVGGLGGFVDIIIKATGLWNGFVDIVLKATPSWGSLPVVGGLSPLMVLSGFFLILFLGWDTIHDREMI